MITLSSSLVNFFNFILGLNYSEYILIVLNIKIKKISNFVNERGKHKFPLLDNVPNY